MTQPTTEPISAEKLSLLKVGELAKRTGKTVRAVHLYEELGLLAPAVRSKGGFRLYHARAATRIEWISKLQDLGFSLTEIKAFLRDWEQSETAPKAMSRLREIFSDKLRETHDTIGRLTQLVTDLQETLNYMDSCRSCGPDHGQSETAPKAMSRLREIFSDKLRETRDTIGRLTQLVTDLQETLNYMDSCRSCGPDHGQSECGTCDINGHGGKAPLLVDGISKS